MIDSGVTKKLKNRDESAFDLVYNEYSRLLYYVIFKIVDNTEDSYDILQDTFVTLMEKSESLEAEKNLKFYLIAIAKNKSYDLVSKRQRELLYLSSRSESIKESEEVVISESLEEIIGRYGVNVTAEESELIVLHLKMDLTFKEIASLKGATINQVKSKYNRAILKMKKGAS